MTINQPDILNQIYRVITTTPQILTPDFIEELLTTVLPIAESNVDNDIVENVINLVYCKFRDDRDKIKALYRKSFDDVEPETTPGYETVTNTYPDIKKLELSLKKRIDKAPNTSNSDAKN
ncbi:hypothetical protein BCD67_20660 [Oscillatoriales cyanobacterium USR001]|nr:hypothetical protein BCD67_20660 [Oscillatoriales cyanobacterium USR001]